MQASRVIRGLYAQCRGLALRHRAAGGAERLADGRGGSLRHKDRIEAGDSKALGQALDARSPPMPPSSWMASKGGIAKRTPAINCANIKVD